MPKTILIIENEAPFAEEMSGALEAMGYQVRVTGDGKVGLELARDLGPDAIVLCVELPKLSGYSICNKLKKDDALRSIPIVLTSSEATEEVFDDHRKLKVHAEAYLIKPYVSATLLEKLGELIGLPEGGGAPAFPGDDASLDGGDAELVSLEDELPLEAFAGAPVEELPAIDLDSLPDEPAPAVAGGGDLENDLKLLDDAFDSLSTPAAAREATPAAEATAAGQAIEKALGVDRPVTSEDLEAASASLPDEEDDGGGADLGGLTDEADAALESLDDAPSAPATSAFDALDALGTVDEPAAARSGPGSPAIEALAGAAAVVTAAGLAAGALGGASGAGGTARLEPELGALRTAAGASELELRDLQGRLRELETALRKQEAESASLKARGEALAAQARKAEADAGAAREEARLATGKARAAEAKAAGSEERAASAEARLDASEGRCRTAEQEAAAQRLAAEHAAATLSARSAELAAAKTAASRVAELEAEVGAARKEAESAGADAERRSADLRRRLGELEAANTKNEERVVKAYLKIKGDEKVRDKARKALSIALQLLEDGLPAEPAGEKRPRPLPE